MNKKRKKGRKSERKFYKEIWSEKIWEKKEFSLWPFEIDKEKVGEKTEKEEVLGRKRKRSEGKGTQQDIKNKKYRKVKRRIEKKENEENIKKKKIKTEKT